MEFYLKITDQMLKEMNDEFQEWSLKQLFSENGDENSRATAKMKFIIFKRFIIEQAQKGASRKFIFNFLSEKNKIGGTYDTFLRHLKKYNVDQYFSDAYHREKNLTENQQKNRDNFDPQGRLKADKKEVTEAISPPATPKFAHDPSPNKAKLVGDTPNNTPPPKKREWIRG